MWYNERISDETGLSGQGDLLAERTVPAKLVECNEHRKTEGFEVVAYAFEEQGKRQDRRV